MKKTCCCCSSALISIILLIVLAVVGGSWYVFNSYVKPIVGISLWETVGLYSSLHKANESEIVTNPFDAAVDLASFETKFREALFIAEDSEFSIKDIIDEALGDKEPALPEVNKTASTSAMQAEISGNSFMQFLQKINFDFSSLSNYDGDTAKGVMNATDKEIAALVNLALMTAVGDMLPDSGIIAGLDEHIQLRQVVVNGGVESKMQDKLSVTMSLNLREFAVNVIDSTMSGTSAAVVGNAVNLLKGIIPKTIYLTVNIAPYDESIKPTFLINSFSDKNQAKTIELINNVMNYSKKTDGIDHLSAVMETIDKKIKSVFSTVDKYVALDFIGNSASMDTIQVMLTTLKLEMVTKTDFLYMISYINCRDLSIFDAISYDKEAINGFITSFKGSYAVADSYEITKDNFLNVLGGVPQNIDLNKINLEKLNDDIDTLLSYDALIEIMSSAMKKEPVVAPVADGGSAMNDIIKTLEIKGLKLQNAETEEISLLIKIPLEQMVISMLGATPDAIMLHLVEQMLPEHLYLELAVELIENGKVSVNVNGLDITASRGLFDTIKALMTTFVGADKAKDFSYDGMSELVGNEVKGAVDTIEKHPTAPIDLKFSDKGVELPTIYELMQLLLKIEGEVNGVPITPDDIRETIKGSNELTEVEKSIVNQSTAADKSSAFAIQNPRIVKKEDKWLAAGEPNIIIADKEMNETAKKSSGGDAADYKIDIVQTIFADLSSDAEVTSALLDDSTGNGFFIEKIKEFTMDTLVMTVKIELKLPPSSDSNMSVVPQFIYATVISDLAQINDGGTRFYINNMGEINTKIVELMMSSLAKKTINFQQMLSDTLKKFTSSTMEIKYSSETINVPGVGDISGVNFSDEELTVTDIIKFGDIINMASTTNCFGEFRIVKTIEMDVTDLVNDIIGGQTPPVPKSLVWNNA